MIGNVYFIFYLLNNASNIKGYIGDRNIFVRKKVVHWQGLISDWLHIKCLEEWTTECFTYLLVGDAIYTL